MIDAIIEWIACGIAAVLVLALCVALVLTATNDTYVPCHIEAHQGWDLEECPGHPDNR